MSDRSEVCSRCRFFAPHEWPTQELRLKQPGECRHDIPARSGQRWPRIEEGSSDWCGRFEARPLPGQ